MAAEECSKSQRRRGEGDDRVNTYKELVFTADKTQRMNKWLQLNQPDLMRLGAELFPGIGLTQIQLQVRSEHDTGEVVGLKVYICMGSAPLEKESDESD